MTDSENNSQEGTAADTDRKTFTEQAHYDILLEVTGGEIFLDSLIYDQEGQAYLKHGEKIMPAYAAYLLARRIWQENDTAFTVEGFLITLQALYKKLKVALLGDCTLLPHKDIEERSKLTVKTVEPAGELPGRDIEIFNLYEDFSLFVLGNDNVISQLKKVVTNRNPLEMAIDAYLQALCVRQNPFENDEEKIVYLLENYFSTHTFKGDSEKTRLFKEYLIASNLLMHYIAPNLTPENKEYNETLNNVVSNKNNCIEEYSKDQHIKELIDKALAANKTLIQYCIDNNTDVNLNDFDL